MQRRITQPKHILNRNPTLSDPLQIPHVSTPVSNHHFLAYALSTFSHVEAQALHAGITRTKYNVDKALIIK